MKKKVQKKTVKQKSVKATKTVIPKPVTSVVTISDRLYRLAYAAGKPGVSTQSEMLQQAEKLGLLKDKKVAVYNWTCRTKKKRIIVWDFSPSGVIYSPAHLKITYESAPDTIAKLLKVECRTIYHDIKYV